MNIFTCEFYNKLFSLDGYVKQDGLYLWENVITCNIFIRVLYIFSMTCNNLLVIGEVLSGKTHYVEQLLEADKNYKGHELI